METRREALGGIVRTQIARVRHGSRRPDGVWSVIAHVCSAARRMFLSCILLYTAMIVCVLPINAQETLHVQQSGSAAADTLGPQNSASFLAGQNLSTFTWLGRANIDTSFSGFRLGLREQYVATIVSLESTSPRKAQSNQQQSTLTLSHPVSSLLTPTFEWDSFVYTDSRAVGLSRAYTHTLLGGVQYAVLPELTLSPQAGYRWENQTGFRDHGASIVLGATLSPLDLDGYIFDASGQFRKDQLNPRILENDFVRTGIFRRFSDETRDSLLVSAANLRREYYSADSSIESRKESYFQIANLLSYDVLQAFQTRFYVGVTTHVLDKSLLYPYTLRPSDSYNTSVDEFKLDSYVEGTWIDPQSKMAGNIRFGYSERDEQHDIRLTSGQIDGPLAAVRRTEEQSKNNLSRRTTLSGRFQMPVSQSDFLTAAASASLLRYDTPSASNVEDRDELLVVASLGTQDHISPTLDVDVSLDGTLSHLVYLLADRSANNNISRTLRLSPRTMFHPYSWLASRNGFDVMASYTVYDFEVEGQSVQSYSYRQFGWIDSTCIEVTHRVGLDFYSYLKLYERGELDWSSFTERLENSYIDKLITCLARFSPSPAMLFAAGIRFSSQIRYAYGDEGKTLDSYSRSIGPMGAILWNPTGYGQVALRGWYEGRRSGGVAIKGLLTMTLSVTMNL